MDQALSGFRVLEFGHYIPDPYTAMLLSEQGAEVIKVESPAPETLSERRFPPPWDKQMKK